jgi:hypothetical protein
MPYYCVACSVTAQQSGDLQAQQLENIRKLIFSYNAKPQAPIPKHQKKRCHPEPFLSHANNPTHNLKTKRGIKREKDLAELLRRAKGHA